jgi:hypothetical protein
MGFLLTQGSTVMCAHGGTATATVPYTRVTVGGEPALQQSCIHSVAGCPLSSVPSPFCVTGTWIMGAMRLTGGGQPLLLQDSQSTCVAPGTPLTVVLTQVRVQGQ